MHPASPPALLQIAPRFCQPPTAGAEFRVLYLASRLARYFPVTHVGFLPPHTEKPAVEDTPCHSFIAVPRKGAYRPVDLLRGAVGPVPFTVLNYTRTEMRDVLNGLFARQPYGIAVLEGVHLGGYLSQLRSAPSRPAVVCDWHNVESEILHRYSQTAPGPHRRLYAGISAGRLERYERWFVNQCDMHVVVSDRDRDTLVRRYGATVPVVVIENGVPLDRFLSPQGLSSRGPSAPRFRVLFTGAMDYHANVEAATSFANEVWPQVHAAAPHAVFTIVGRNPAAAVRELAGRPGIQVTGTVPDVRPYYREALAAVVPLRVGGGTRIKILEAMAARVPVVATAVGAEGLAALPGRHYLLADSAEQMRSALSDLLQYPEKAARLASAAHDFIRQRHDWATLGDRLAEQLMGLLSKRVQAEGQR